jgi:tetratricopeptide (TPR) repeat protein
MKFIFVRVITCIAALSFCSCFLLACTNPANMASEHIKQGDVYFQQGNFDLAISEYTRAGELDPSIDVQAKVNQANEKKVGLLLQVGDYDKSIEAGISALAAAPEDDSLREKLADAYIARAWYYKAKRLNPYTLTDLFKAIEIAPKYYRAYYEMGRFHNNQWQFSIGILDLNKALSLKPDFAPAYSERAYSHYKNQKYEAGLADANMAIELDPTDAQFYYNRSLVYRGMGKNDLAVSDLETTLKLSKDTALTDKAGADLLLLQPK